MQVFNREMEAKKFNGTSRDSEVRELVAQQVIGNESNGVIHMKRVDMQVFKSISREI